MDNNEKEKNIPILDFDKDNCSNDYDYKLLLQKLKIIKDTIIFLEKNFLGNKR